MQGFLNAVRFRCVSGPPPLPPGRGWQAGYRESADDAAIQEWREGFALGAARAQSCGYFGDAILPPLMASSQPADTDSDTAEWINSSSGWDGDSDDAHESMARLPGVADRGEDLQRSRSGSDDKLTAESGDQRESSPPMLLSTPSTPDAVLAPVIPPMPPLPLQRADDASIARSANRAAGSNPDSGTASRTPLDIPDGLFDSPTPLKLPDEKPADTPTDYEVPQAPQGLQSIKPVSYIAEEEEHAEEEEPLAEELQISPPAAVPPAPMPPAPVPPDMSAVRPEVWKLFRTSQSAEPAQP
jgi:hypothetical protein